MSKKISKKDFEYLCAIISFLGKLVTSEEDFES